MAEKKVQFACPPQLLERYRAIGDEILELMEEACGSPKARNDFQGQIGQVALQLLIRATMEDRLDALEVIHGRRVQIARNNLRKRQGPAKPADDPVSVAEAAGDDTAAGKPTARPKPPHRRRQGKTGS